jgi:hypothetical protein
MGKTSSNDSFAPGSTVFKSKIKRDILGTVSRDYLQNPGPGAYDLTKSLDKLNTNSDNNSVLMGD